MRKKTHSELILSFCHSKGRLVANSQNAEHVPIIRNNLALSSKIPYMNIWFEIILLFCCLASTLQNKNHINGSSVKYLSNFTVRELLNGPKWS